MPELVHIEGFFECPAETCRGTPLACLKCLVDMLSKEWSDLNTKMETESNDAMPEQEEVDRINRIFSSVVDGKCKARLTANSGYFLKHEDDEDDRLAGD
jgi:hypothetical protein